MHRYMKANNNCTKSKKSNFFEFSIEINSFTACFKKPNICGLVDRLLPLPWKLTLRVRFLRAP